MQADTISLPPSYCPVLKKFTASFLVQEKGHSHIEERKNSSPPHSENCSVELLPFL